MSSPLTTQFNALREGLEVLDEHDLYGGRAACLRCNIRRMRRSPALRQAQGGTEAKLTESSDHPLAYKTITELGHMLRTRQVSSVELTRMYLDRVERFDDELRSYVTVTAEFALEQAARADEALARGETVGPLAGIPLAHKDEFYTKDILTTCGSSILSEFVPDFDATPIARFHETGAVMLGKLNMTEFASPVTWVFPYGQPRNPGTWSTTPAGRAQAPASRSRRRYARGRWPRTRAARYGVRRRATARSASVRRWDV